jgi:Co/Zn/Cd efflux system component
MSRYLSRWTVSAGWIVAMLAIWAMFVPTSISPVTALLIGLAGLLVTFFGITVLQDGESPRSVSAILTDLEAEPKKPGLEARQP